MDLSNYLRESVSYIGLIQSQITGNKLPNKKQVLQVLFFNIRHLKRSTRESASIVGEEVRLFWDKAGIPTQSPQKCIEKIEKLYNEFRLVQKSDGKAFNKQREIDFEADLEMLFDIASQSESKMSQIEEISRTFLQNQRLKGRPGFIGNVQTVHDLELTIEEVDRILELRREKEEKKRKREYSDFSKNILL